MRKIRPTAWYDLCADRFLFRHQSKPCVRNSVADSSKRSGSKQGKTNRIVIQPVGDYTLELSSDATTSKNPAHFDNETTIMTCIPKGSVTYVPIGQYTMSDVCVRPLPILVERMHTSVQVAIYLLPQHGTSDASAVLMGVITTRDCRPSLDFSQDNATKSMFDELKRLLIYKFDYIPTNQSVLVTARNAVAERDPHTLRLFDATKMEIESQRRSCVVQTIQGHHFCKWNQPLGIQQRLL
jgi:hypothetical protein